MPVLRALGIARLFQHSEVSATSCHAGLRPLQLLVQKWFGYSWLSSFLQEENLQTGFYGVIAMQHVSEKFRGPCFSFRGSVCLLHHPYRGRRQCTGFSCIYVGVTWIGP